MTGSWRGLVYAEVQGGQVATIVGLVGRGEVEDDGEGGVRYLGGKEGVTLVFRIWIPIQVYRIRYFLHLRTRIRIRHI